MRKYLLPEKGNFYKANLHSHSVISDGMLTAKEMKDFYMERGYSIIAFTDHDIFIPHNDLTDDNFLALNGYEIEVGFTYDIKFRELKICHFCLIALDPEMNTQYFYHRTRPVNFKDEYRHLINADEKTLDFETERTPECISMMMKTARDNGFFVTYNHPTWSLENYTDYINYHNMHAMEICNYGCVVSGHPEYNERVYDDMLRAGKKIYCIGTDDNHNCNGDEDSFGAFTVIKAENLEYKTVADALVKGNFYASQGPEIFELYYEDEKVYVKCSDAKTIRLSTDGRRVKRFEAPCGETINEAVFELTPDDKYIRITIVDAEGKHANTNAYFCDELRR